MACQTKQQLDEIDLLNTSDLTSTDLLVTTSPNLTLIQQTVLNQCFHPLEQKCASDSRSTFSMTLVYSMRLEQCVWAGPVILSVSQSAFQKRFSSYSTKPEFNKQKENQRYIHTTLISAHASSSTNHKNCLQMYFSSLNEHFPPSRRWPRQGVDSFVTSLWRTILLASLSFKRNFRLPALFLCHHRLASVDHLIRRLCTNKCDRI